MSGRPGRPTGPAVPLEARLQRRIEETSAGCWEWIGARTGAYGRITIDRKVRYTHRVAYELWVGPIPEGHHLDHLCRNPPCMNPAHLEPVLPVENTRRSLGNHRRTHCPAGHPYDEANTVVYEGHRKCRACRTRRNRARVAA